MEKILKEIAACKERYENMLEGENAAEVTREEFTLLLGGISACRKVPGIPKHMGYERLYFCESGETAGQVQQHLEQMYHIKDKDSFMEGCQHIFTGGWEYQDFMTFWKGAPLFDIRELQPRGRKAFEQSKKLAEIFYPFLEEKGFYAWDISEKIGLCRSAAACGIISEEEFWQITDEWVRLAQVFYHSYGEYALSCLCGAVYYMGRQGLENDHGFLELNKNIIDSLLAEGGAWQRNRWYVPKEREWTSLVENGGAGCLITKKALESGFIGYMYRDTPQADIDSGWCFFVGDEPKEYIDNPDNISVCTLDTVCNLSPDIIAYMHAGVGRRFGRQDGVWKEE